MRLGLAWPEHHLYLSGHRNADLALCLALADALATVEYVKDQVSRGYVRGSNTVSEWVTPLAAIELASSERYPTDSSARLSRAARVRDAGCEPVVVGDLAAARSFQRGGPGFRARLTAADLRRRLGFNRLRRPPKWRDLVLNR